MFSESGFTHGDLLQGYIQYVGRSLKVNGSFCKDTYTETSLLSCKPVLAVSSTGRCNAIINQGGHCQLKCCNHQ
ncbi:hypothetical protein EYY90_19035 [Hafnia alvei]|nr:hypothetical protein [Escherichia coli]TBL92049.1 hypothetical protein EYY90_19035 [Hafnia alvei]TCC73026.1 hypothetical protein EY920_10085 [Citrobacter braakii]HCU13588.1 hypothetical protein [Hafnia paralvei]